MQLGVPGVPDLSAEAMSRLDRVEAAVTAVLSAAGFRRVVPPVMELAEPFIETSGEDIRRRLYSFTDPSGVEFCLRPDLTIPTCRLYLRSGAPGPARLMASGPAFRHQAPGSVRPRQFQQIGAEFFDAADAVAADAEMIALAAKSAAAAGFADAPVQFGDPGLLMQVMEKLDLPTRAQVRLRRALGDAGALAALLDGGTMSDHGQPTLVQTLGALSPDRARALIDEVLGLAGIQPVGGRGADEIAERLMAQAADRAGPVIPGKAARVIRDFLDVTGPAEKTVDRLSGLLSPLGLDADGFRRRLDLIARAGLDPARLHFSGSFSRAIDYYTGIVFEIGSGNADVGPIAAGGRYDGLPARLGAGRAIPAIGFAVWPERAIDIASAEPGAGR